MAKGGVKKAKRRGKKTFKKARKPSKSPRKPVKAVRISKKTGKTTIKKILKPAKPVVKSPAAEEKRVLKKLPPAKPLKSSRQVMRVFGHEINPKRIQAAAVEAYSKRCYSIDDIPVDNFIRESEWDNLMTKIGILDRIEEQLNLMYPHVDVVRRNKISLELYLRE